MPHVRSQCSDPHSYCVKYKISLSIIIYSSCTFRRVLCGINLTLWPCGPQTPHNYSLVKLARLAEPGHCESGLLFMNEKSWSPRNMSTMQMQVYFPFLLIPKPYSNRQPSLQLFSPIVGKIVRSSTHET